MIRGRSSANDRDARRESIARSLMSHGARRIDDIAEEYDVSPMTIYRDIDYLSSQGVARRDRGFATALVASMSEVSTTIRMNQNVETKKRLGSAAANLITGRDVVAIDESTTSIFALDAMADSPPATVITYSHTALQRASKLEGVSIVFCGGDYRSQVDACVGQTTVEEIAKVYADVAIVSVTAVKNGACLHADEEIADVKRAMLANAGRRILIIDRTKFGRTALHHVVDLAEFTDIVTEPTTHVDFSDVQDRGVKVHTF